MALPIPQFKVGVSTGLYRIAAPAELASVVRKLGFALTRGTNVIEISGDVPHEINYTDGRELRYIAEKQGLELMLHGSLTIPITMPERGEWRDAHDHLCKSLKSAVYGGCKYVNIHSCLHFWLEMMTYAGRKLTMAFCDHEGNFISKILFESEKLREWFVEEKWDVYYGDILSSDEIIKARSRAAVEVSDWRSKEIERRLRELGLTEEQIRHILTTGVIPRELEPRREEIEGVMDKIRIEGARRSAEVEEKHLKDTIKDKLSDPSPEKRKWRSEELRAIVGIVDGYHIMAHYIFYKKDPIWQEMAKMYKEVIDRYKTVTFKGKEYAYPNGTYWVDGAWEEAEAKNDREFKEFYYAVCAAKYLEGHIKKALDWIDDELPDIIDDEVEDEGERKALKDFADELQITIETPDARAPEYAGLYNIWHPKQIYAAVKVIRDVLDTDRVFMLIDFEHVATQGVDPLTEIENFVDIASDAGEYILSLHVTKPSPLHHHLQVEIGDIDVYKLLWHLRKADLGKHHTTYLIFERGGERDPFKQSVTAIQLMVDQLIRDVKPEELITKPEFFGVATGELASEERQLVTIREHFFDPLKGVIAIPEEEFTFLGRKATEKPGVPPEKWKKEELK